MNPLIDTVRSAHDKMLEEKRAEVLETVRQCMEATHTAANGDSKVSHLIEKSDRYFSQCKEKIAELKSLALLDAMFLPMCQYKDDTVSNIESVLEPPAPKPQVQPTQQGKEQATAKKKENKFVAFVKKHKVLSTIVGLILLFVLSLGTTLGIANATRTKDVAIPNLVGKTVDEAKKLVQDSKLVYSEGEAEYSADVEKGTALIDIKYGTTIFIKESSAPEGYLLSPEVVKVSLNSEGLFVNDENVETDEDLTYSIAYQNTLLPVIQEGVQTGYDNNMPIYIIISGISLSGVIAIALSLRKKKRK